ncbi:MAG: exodeoxyribonuclease VII small subunit [Candidatus Omnitrophota bacterium]
MSQHAQSKNYEDNYAILEKIIESLNKDEISVDDLVEKTKEALDAARTCMDILNCQKGEFKKLEIEFSKVLNSSMDDSRPATGETENPDSRAENIGQDDPF